MNWSNFWRKQPWWKPFCGWLPYDRYDEVFVVAWLGVAISVVKRFRY